MSHLGDGIRAGLIAGVVSGAPSTVHALATGGDALAATAAAGTLVLRNENRRPLLLVAAVPVHFALSIGWGVVLAAALPRRRGTMWGALAGLAIAALDLGVVGRRFPAIRALPIAPQVADHLLYGATVGTVLATARSRGSPGRPWRREAARQCRIGRRSGPA